MASVSANRVKFNVGGTIFETTRSTLEKLGSEYFARLLDRNSGFTQPQDGIYFIDRDPECFRVILNIARYGEVFFTDKKMNLEVLEREAEFYLLGGYPRNLISSYKKKSNAEKMQPKMLVPKVDIRMDLSANNFTSSKNDFVYHHARLENNSRISSYVSWVCAVNEKCTLGVHEDAQSVECCRCLREFVMETHTDELLGWCHRCHRCLRCIDAVCMPIKV